MILHPVTRTPSYVHDQPTPAAVWNITHNLGKYPSVEIIDSSHRIVLGGRVEYLDQNRLRVTFGGAFGGQAILN